MRRIFYNPLNLSKEVKWLSGAACFAEIARCAGSWDSKAIEDRVKNGLISLGEADPDNGMRRLLRGELPSDRTIGRLLGAYPAFEIPYWRDHGLWVVLEAETPSVPRILRALDTLSPAIRNVIVASSNDQPNQTVHFKHFDAETIRALEALGGSDAMLALTALVRHCDASATMHLRDIVAAATLSLFPRVVGVSPHLFVSWPLLFKRFADSIWRRSLSETASPHELKAVTRHLSRIASAARRVGVSLPPDRIVARSLSAIAQCPRRSGGNPSDIAAAVLSSAG
jgi:hypothetical protein